MNKEEILKASREENQNQDIYEKEVIFKAQRVGGLMGITIAFIIMTLEAMFTEHINYGYFLIIIMGAGSLMLYKALKLKKKHEFIISIIYVLMAIFALYTYIINFGK